MKKEEIKGKVKEFTQNHKKGLQTVGIAGLAVSGVYFGWKLCDVIKIGDNVMLKSTNPLADVFKDSVRKYGRNGWTFLSIENDALNADQLGKLGEFMKSDSGYIDGETFTHFIAIGPDPTK